MDPTRAKFFTRRDVGELKTVTLKNMKLLFLSRISSFEFNNVKRARNKNESKTNISCLSIE